MKYYIKQFLFLLFNLLFITTFSQWNNSNSINGNSTVTFNASKVLPNNTIFLIGDDGLTLFNRSGVIYKSTDNGVSFTKTNTLPKAYQLSSANFIDNNNGFVFGQTQSFKGFIARTTDGGVSWISDSINETEQLKSNSFINSQIGYVADFTLGNLKLYKTINGGNRWSMICDKYYQSGAVNDLQFLTENLGFICTQTKTSSFRYAKVMRTTDGGNNWTTLKYSLDEDYTSIHFFDYYNGFVLTFSGKIYKTTNAGTTWTLVRNSTDIQNCNELKFINPIVGYVISADSILRTTDAGNTWTNIHNISTLSLFGYNTLDVNSNGIGIAAGGVGSFYSYTNNFGGTSSNNTISSAYISGYDSTCTGQNGTIRFDFTGTPPWSISYSNGTTTLSETNITSTPFFIPVPTTATRQVYTINSFSSNGINSVNYYGKAILSVLNSQAVSATISGTKAICISDSTKLSVQLKGNKPFTFTYSDGIGNNTISNVYDTVYTFFIKPTETKTYTLVSVYDKCNNSGIINGNAIITVNSPPIAPTNLSAYTFNYNMIKLSWIDNATNEDSIIVERRYDSIPDFTRLKALPANSITFIDSTNKVNYKYHYRLKYVINNANCSSYSISVNYIIKPLFNIVNTITLPNIVYRIGLNNWYDWDNDGDLDNVNRKLILNMGNDSFLVVNDTLLEKVLANNLRIYDFNKDSRPDIFSYDLVGYNYTTNNPKYLLKTFKGIGNNRFNEIDTFFNKTDTINGYPNSDSYINIVDLDGDGTNEFVKGTNFLNYNIFNRFTDTALSWIYSVATSSRFEFREARRGKSSCAPNNLFPINTVTTGSFYNFYKCNIYDLDNDGNLDYLLNEDNDAGIALLSSSNINNTPKRMIYGDYDAYASYSNGLAFEDFDNDGYIDVISDNFDSDLYDHMGLNLLLNDKNGNLIFVDAGFSNIRTTGALSICDYNKDGKVDFSTQDKIYKNSITNNNKWININCIGSVSARIPYGTRIKIKTTIDGVSMWQTRDIITHSISRANYSTIVHFGLGNATQIDSIKIFWPSGIIWDSTNISPNQNIDITEPYIVYPKILEKPTNFTCNININNGYFLSISEVYLSWCSALNAQTYTVQRKKIGEPNFNTVTILPKDKVSYLDTSLMPNTKYIYRIVADGYNQTTYSDTVLIKTEKIRLRLENSYNTSITNPNTKVFYTASKSKTLKLDVYINPNSTTYNKVATINAFSSDSFINYPFYLDKNTSRNNIVCYYFVAYYPSDSLTKSYSDTQCIRIGDYCLPQSRLYGLYAQSGNNNVINNPEPSLCLPGISIQTYSSRDVLNYNCDWYWNDSVLLNETETYHNLNDSSKKGFYRVIFNSGSVCPDTSNKVYVNVDGDGYNKITFEVLQKNLHKYANSTLNYICSSDTIFLKVKSKYPIYDSATISSNSNNHYVTKSFVKDSSYYKIYLLDANINPDNFYVGSLKIFDKYHPTCSIQTPFLFLPFINSNININFKNNDSIILGDFNTDLILTTTIADPLWQFRKHTSSPWINIPNNLYTNNNNIPTLNFLNYRRSGYYRVIDTICNSISREAVGLFSNSNEVIEGQLFDSTNILMPNTPYTFNMYSDLSHLNLIKTINGITDANGRFILDSLPYNPNVRNLGYYWTITFIKDGLTKSFSDTVINNFKIHVSWYDLAVYQLRLVFKLSNPVGIKENKVLENLSIYPNPTKNNINIKFNNKFPTQLSITILNNLGQVVLNPENNRHIQNGIFNSDYVLNLSKGLYLIRINLGDEQVTQKLIVQ